MTPAPGHTDSGGGREQVRDRRKCRNTDRGTESGRKRDSSRRKIQQAATAHISQKQRDRTSCQRQPRTAKSADQLTWRQLMDLRRGWVGCPKAAPNSRMGPLPALAE